MNWKELSSLDTADSGRGELREIKAPANLDEWRRKASRCAP
jgi:hypothetical protein